MIVAKPVVPDQYWILQENNQKIGNIEANPDGFAVRINNDITNYKTLSMIQERISVDFQLVEKKLVEAPEFQVHGFDTVEKPYNPVLDIKHQLPLYTCEPRSRSWYAAGWYRVRQGRNWDVVQCPKLILLQRYRYQGPFKTKQEAESK